MTSSSTATRRVPDGQRLDPASYRDAERALRQANLEFVRRHPGDPAGRQPVHTVYGGAQLFGADAAAAEAWMAALQARFDPALAVRAAEALTRAEGRVTDASAALFRRALVGAPPNAPWRATAETRLGPGAFGPRR